MEVLQKITSRFTVPNLEGKTGTLQALIIEPNQDYRLNFNRKETQHDRDSWILYLVDFPYGHKEYLQRDFNHHLHYTNPHLIVETENGVRHVSEEPGRGIELKGCHNQITFSIAGDFPTCDSCNTLWLRVKFFKWKYHDDDDDDDDDDDEEEEGKYQDMPIVIRSVVQ
jgi:hypothetical protein